MKKAKQRLTKARFKHYYRFTIKGATGEKDIHFFSKATVRIPKRVVVLPLEAEDVRRSIELDGVGNTQTCSMAVCTVKHKDSFQHKVVGFVDWYYNRAYIASKINSEGLPSECYVYEHRDSVARVNDSKDGHKKLLRSLEENGSRLVKLYPPRPSPERPGRKRGKNTGERSRAKTVLAKGAKLRSAFALRGGVPQLSA